MHYGASSSELGPLKWGRPQNGKDLREVRSQNGGIGSEPRRSLVRRGNSGMAKSDGRSRIDSEIYGFLRRSTW